MKSEIISQEANKVVIKAELTAEDFQKEVDLAVKEVSKKANLKGFRKGHVPRKTLEMFFGKKVFCQEAVDKLGQQIVDELISEYDMAIIEEPDVEIGTAEEGRAFDMTITFTLRPEVTLPDIESIEVSAVQIAVEDEDVEKQIKEFLNSSAEVKELDGNNDGKDITENDIVLLEYASYLLDGNGEPLELDKTDESYIDLSDKAIRPDIRDAILAHKVGDTFDVELVVESDHQNKEIAGKTVRYVMTALNLAEKIVPAFDNDFAVKFTQGKHLTTEDMLKTVREGIEKAARAQTDKLARDKAVRALCDACEADIPADMVTKRMEEIKRRHKARIEEEKGLSWEEYLAQNSIDDTEVWKNLEEIAHREVKQGLVLEVLAEKEGISWTQEDVAHYIRTLAASWEMPLEDLRKNFMSDKNFQAHAVSEIVLKKTIDFLMTKVALTTDIKTKEVIFEEMKMFAAAAAEAEKEAQNETKDETNNEPEKGDA